LLEDQGAAAGHTALEGQVIAHDEGCGFVPVALPPADQGPLRLGLECSVSRR
jgi:hypothetical protein